MKTRRIYFAGAIRGGRGNAAVYAEIVTMLHPYGEVLTEHIGDGTLTAAGETMLTDREIYERDLRWLRSADVLVAEVTTPSLGVGYEIAKMTEWKKPVLCLFRPAEGRNLSALIVGEPAIEICQYQTTAQLASAFERFFESN
jgi:hypothetical protein